MRMAIDSRNAVYAGIAAGVIATVVQLVLWWAFWDVLPAIFFRDVRLAAAILLGSTILPPPVSFDWLAFGAASVVHFSLSVVCSFILAVAIARRRMRSAALCRQHVRLYPSLSVVRDCPRLDYPGHSRRLWPRGRRRLYATHGQGAPPRHRQCQGIRRVTRPANINR